MATEKLKFSRGGESFDFHNLCNYFNPAAYPKGMVCANCHGGKCHSPSNEQDPELRRSPRDPHGRPIPEEVLPKHGYPDDALEQLQRKQFIEHLESHRDPNSPWRAPIDRTPRPEQPADTDDAYIKLLKKLPNLSNIPRRTEQIIRESERILGGHPYELTLGSCFNFKRHGQNLGQGNGEET